jgi:hypothetical protein
MKSTRNARRRAAKERHAASPQKDLGMSTNFAPHWACPKPGFCTFSGRCQTHEPCGRKGRPDVSREQLASDLDRQGIDHNLTDKAKEA